MGADRQWLPATRGQGRVDVAQGIVLTLEAATSHAPALAQFGDAVDSLHRGALWQPPLLLQARLRFSHPAGQFVGTAGLGFWNGPSLHASPVAPPFMDHGSHKEFLPRRRPQWLWFYYASPPAVFSLLPGPPHGLKASVLAARGGSLASTAVVPLLKAPPGTTARPVPATEMTLDGCLLTGWHTYRIAWLADEALFQVDDQPVLRTRLLPVPPLAFVAWMDNQYTWLDGSGIWRVGLLGIDRMQRVEIADLDISSL